MLTIINNNKSKGKTIFIYSFFKIQRKNVYVFHIKSQNKCQFNNGRPANIGRPLKGDSVYTDL